MLHCFSGSTGDLIAIYEKIFEISPDGFVFVNTEGKIIYINPSYCHQLAVRREDALNKPVLEVIKNSILPELIKNEDDTEERNVFWSVVKGQYKTKEKYVIVTRCIVRNDKGIVIGAVGQVKFINETLRLAQTLNDLNDELNYYKEELHRLGGSKYSFENILGASKIIENIKKIAKKAAANDFTVLLTGETGTGKEIFANAIHYASRRKNKPLIRINCAAIPHDLFESELFGYVEGAFTGAKRGGKKGKMELANGGTLFLDEIGDMPMFMQVKLLRVLQERELERVGGEKTIPIDIRVIAATNKNLLDEIEQRRFRADLYYRLNVISIAIPPLRERREDIKIFICKFLETINRQYFTNVSLSQEAEETLTSYTWPGNVRELKNTIERAYTLSNNNIILNAHLPSHIFSKSKLKNTSNGQSLNEMMSLIEKELLIEAIEKNNKNMRKTAQSLGIHRSTLYKKIEQYEIKRDDLTDNP